MLLLLLRSNTFYLYLSYDKVCMYSIFPLSETPDNWDCCLVGRDMHVP